ncbi:hypothetical protein HanPI659440_Chr02g0042351 [Helianthus annuus]|nr:hypothetical protein HanPI659440_Chr02g0042351 [Helianthus annuus]
MWFEKVNRKGSRHGQNQTEMFREVSTYLVFYWFMYERISSQFHIIHILHKIHIDSVVFKDLVTSKVGLFFI